jgi:hypothetical protein
MAWDNGYTYRRSITIDNTKVSGSGDLTNFAVLISGTYAYLATVANAGKVENANGYDIIFTSDADGATVLDFEVQRYTATTGEVIFWVKVPTVDGDADTTFYMFYGNSSVSTDQSDKNNTWDTAYKAVLHLQESGNSTVDEYIDSTVNANHGEGGKDAGTTTPDRVTGKIGYAQEFKASSSHGIAIPHDNTLDLSADATLSLWIKSGSTTSSVWEIIFAKRNAGGKNWNAFIWESSDDFSFEGNSTGRSDDTLSSSWQLLHFVVDQGTDTKLYINGSLAYTFSGVYFGSTNTADLTLGYWLDNGTAKEFLSAILQEVRVCTGLLSTDWMLTEYNNQNDPSTFYTVGDEEEAPVAGVSAYGEDGCGLLSNSSFEVDLDGWAADAQYSRTVEDAYHGAISVKLESSGAFENFYTEAAGITVERNTFYRLKFWAKIFTNGLGVIIQINIGSAFGTTIASQAVSSTNNTWQEQELVFNSGDNTKVWIRIFNNNSSITAYFDKFCLNAFDVGTASPTQKHFYYRVFDGATIKGVWTDDVISEPSFKVNINGGYSDMKVTLARPFDDFGEDVDVKLNNKVECWVVDKESPNGKLLYTGYIAGYAPELDEEEEKVQVTLFPFEAELNRMVLRDSSGNTTLAYNSYDPGNILKDAIDKYKGILGGHLRYTSTSIALTNTVVSYTFNTNTLKEVLDKVVELCPVGWYYRIDPDGVIYLQPRNLLADYTFTLGLEVTGLRTYRRIEDLVNRVLFVGGGDPPLFRKYENTGSQQQYGLYEKKIVDQRVTVVATAQTMSEREIEQKKDPEIRSTFTIMDSNGRRSKGFDIESLQVGKTLKIKNLNTGRKAQSLWDTAVWDVDVWDQTLSTSAADIIQILSLSYEPDSIVIEASSRLPQIAKRIEDIDRNLQASQTVNNPAAPS